MESVRTKMLIVTLAVLSLIVSSLSMAEEIKNGLWSAQLHSNSGVYDVLGSFSKQESQNILQTFIKSKIGEPGNQRSLKLKVFTSTGKESSINFGCIHHLPENANNNPGCRIFLNIPFEENLADRLKFSVDKESSIGLLKYLKSNVSPVQNANGIKYEYALGNSRRVQFYCLQKSIEHFPTCGLSMENSFDSYNFVEPGYPDDIELTSDGRVLLNFTTFGNAPSSIAQTLQRLLPILPPLEGDTPGRIRNQLYLNGDDTRNDGRLSCNQYPTRSEGFDIRHCLGIINKVKTKIFPFKLPLNITIALTEESSRSLHKAIGSRIIEGTTFARSNDISSKYDPFVSSRIRLECLEGANACTLGLFHNKRSNPND